MGVWSHEIENPLLAECVIPSLRRKLAAQVVLPSPRQEQHNRKLGSDMADSVTGGGLHGKDLSKADVSINIHAFLKAQQTGNPVELVCAIGDDQVDGLPYSEIVEEARDFVNQLGGFEKLAEWGLF